MRKLYFLSPFLLTFMVFFITCTNKTKNTNTTSSLIEQQTNKKNNLNQKLTPIKVDTKNSILDWVGKKTTGAHNGTVMMEKGILFIDPDGNLIEGKFMLDMETITCTDLSGSKKESLETHLKDEDFFNTEKYPYAHFQIELVTEKKIFGILTIKGISNKIEFLYTKNSPREYVAQIIVDRTQFDIKYKSKTIFPDIGDHFIHDEFTINLNPLYLEIDDNGL